MKLGFLLGYSGKQIHIPMELIQQAESGLRFCVDSRIMGQ